MAHRRRAIRGALVLILVVLASFAGAPHRGLAEGDVERRIAEFWKRVDALQPTEHLLAADLGQWALNVTERNATARISLSDFRAETAVMQIAMDRARTAGAPTPGPGPAAVEARIAEFWQRLDAHQTRDVLSASDIGQWATNVIERDSAARITVRDFRASTASMQGAIDRAGRALAGSVSPLLRFQFTSSIPLLDRVDLERGTRLGAGSLAVLFGDQISEVVTIYAVASAAGEQHVGVKFGKSSCCVAGSKALFGQYAAYYDISNPHWNNPYITGPSRSNEHRKVAVHEYVHIWQDWAGCLLGADFKFSVPVWFFEGMAEYLAQKLTADAGERSAADVAQVTAYYRSEAKRLLSTLPLSSIEAQHPTDGSGEMGPSYTAVKMLAEAHGPLSLRDFCRRGAKEGWRPAFASVFGRSVEVFYQQYSADLSRP